MNEEYSKSKVILESVRSILIGDNQNTGNDVREISHYCGNRIFRGKLRSKQQFPQITINTDEGFNDIVIPSGYYFLEVNSHVVYDSKSPQDTLDDIATRVIFLLDRKSSQLNLATSKNLRCRIIQKMSSMSIEDDLDRVYTRTIRFKMICDDETV